MRRIAILGGRRTALPLAIGLRQRGYEVTVVTSRTWAEVGRGTDPMNGYGFDAATALTQRLGINYWQSQAYRLRQVDVAVGLPTGARPRWTGSIRGCASAIDDRIVTPLWIREFERIGGRVETADLDDIAVVDRYAEQFELVIVAAGRHRVASVFEKVAATPPWHVIAAYAPPPADARDCETLKVRVIPQTVQYAQIPALSVDGGSTLLLLQYSERVAPEWAGDRANQLPPPSLVAALGSAFSEVRDSIDRKEWVTDLPYMHEAIEPGLSRAVAQLPSGRVALGLGEAVVRFDPVSGQSVGAGAQMATTYLDAIVERGPRPFDESWMQETFDRYWRAYGRWARVVSESLRCGASSHLAALCGAARTNSVVADRLSEAFERPSTMASALARRPVAARFLADARQRQQQYGGERKFRRAMARFVTGVAVVAAYAEPDRPIGLTVNSLTSVSLRPPLVLWCCDYRSRYLDIFGEGAHLSVNILSGNQDYLAAQFASPVEDRFAGVDWHRSPGGTPELAGCVAVLDCTVTACHREGDHIVIICRVTGIADTGGEPLAVHDGMMHAISEVA